MVEKDDEFREQVCGRLSDLRDYHHFTNYQISEEIGMSQTAIANVMKKQSMPTLYSLRGMCTMFETPLVDFFITIDQDADRKTVHVTKKAEALLEMFNQMDDERQDELCRMAQVVLMAGKKRK